MCDISWKDTFFFNMLVRRWLFLFHIRVLLAHLSLDLLSTAVAFCISGIYDFWKRQLGSILPIKKDAGKFDLTPHSSKKDYSPLLTQKWSTTRAPFCVRSEHPSLSLDHQVYDRGACPHCHKENLTLNTIESHLQGKTVFINKLTMKMKWKPFSSELSGPPAYIPVFLVKKSVCCDPHGGMYWNSFSLQNVVGSLFKVMPSVFKKKFIPLLLL